MDFGSKENVSKADYCIIEQLNNVIRLAYNRISCEVVQATLQANGLFSIHTESDKQRNMVIFIKGNDNGTWISSKG